MGIKGLFDEHYRDYKTLFAGDRGEAYAVALAIVFGIEAFDSDDTKYGGPHETLLKELIDDVIPFTLYKLLLLKYLKSEISVTNSKSNLIRYLKPCLIQWNTSPGQTRC